MDKFILHLFITGNTPRSETAINNLRRICVGWLAEHSDVLIIDVLENPQMAEDAKILATPTVIKVFPPPQRKVIGDLSDTEKVLLALGLPEAPDRAEQKG